MVPYRSLRHHWSGHSLPLHALKFRKLKIFSFMGTHKIQFSSMWGMQRERELRLMVVWNDIGGHPLVHDIRQNPYFALGARHGGSVSVQKVVSSMKIPINAIFVCLLQKEEGKLTSLVPFLLFW